MSKFYVSTSIAYTNAPPHIGFALELLQADVLARYKRKKGFDVFFLTGTDEHGLKIYNKAQEEGKDPRVFVDEMADKYKSLGERLNISNDFFIRTTDSDLHVRGVEETWKRLEESGDIYKKKYKGLYCSGCEAFKKEKELVSGKCFDHDRKPEIVEEENYFFRLSKYEKAIKEKIEKDELRIAPEGRKKEMLAFLKEGLEDISVSRSKEVLPWGITVPGDEAQVIYVWVDALSNYITALGYGREEEKFRKYWPADVHCIGKDILRFHALIWPGILLSLGLPLPKNIFVHGHITSEGRKMSKTLGNVINPFDLLSRHKTDAVRYYLLREIPSLGDGDYSEERFRERYNADLADGIGNLTARVVAMAKKKNLLNVAEERKSDLLPTLEKKEKEIGDLIEEFRLSEALSVIWEVIHFADGYIEKKRPWEESSESEEAIKDLLVILKFLVTQLDFFLPDTSEKIRNQLETGEKKAIYPKA